MGLCGACGNEMEAEARFCSRCGARLSASDTTTGMPVLDDTTLTNELNSGDIAAIEALPAGSALLVVLKGPGEGSRFLLREDRVVVGRHPDSDIFLDDVTVSRSHAAFIREPGAFAIEDLGSLNGTYVDRQLLRGATALRNGDEVQIGKYKMVYFFGTAGTG